MLFRSARYAVILMLAAAWSLPAQEAWDRALRFHRAGDLNGAIAAYQEVLQAEPGRYDARSNLGAALAAQGRFAEAIDQYRLALESVPPQYAPQLHQNLGLAFYKSGRYSEAIAAFSELSKSQPVDIKTNLLLADSYLQNGEPATAVSVLAPLESSDDKGVAYVLGSALIRAGQTARGQKVIDRILREGDTAESRFLIGSSMFMAGDLPNAVKQFAAALDLNPQLPSVHSFYGQALLNTGDPDGAAAAFRAELALNPYDFDSTLRLGEILVERRQFDAAAPLLQNAARQRPKSLDAQAALAQLEINRHDYTKAIERLEPLAVKSPNAARLHGLLAQAYAGIGRASQAAQQLQLAGSGDDEAGPKPGESAPSFRLPRLQSTASLSLDEFRGGKPMVLLFGSYTCPNFREQASAINTLAAKYHVAAPFLLVYIREAHSGDTWQSTINQRQGIDWQPAKSMPEMQRHAASCVRRLHMDFPAVVDGVDGTTESKYAAWPSRLFVIGRNGRVLYRTRLSELTFHAGEVDVAIQAAIAK